MGELQQRSEVGRLPAVGHRSHGEIIGWWWRREAAPYNK